MKPSRVNQNGEIFDKMVDSESAACLRLADDSSCWLTPANIVGGNNFEINFGDSKEDTKESFHEVPIFCRAQHENDP
jgi:hypothetical protein